MSFVEVKLRATALYGMALVGGKVATQEYINNLKIGDIVWMAYSDIPMIPNKPLKVIRIGKRLEHQIYFKVGYNVVTSDVFEKYGKDKELVRRVLQITPSFDDNKQRGDHG